MPRPPPNNSLSRNPVLPVATVFPGIRTHQNARQGRDRDNLDRHRPQHGPQQQPQQTCSGCMRNLSPECRTFERETSFIDDAEAGGGNAGVSDRRTAPTSQLHGSSNRGGRPPNVNSPPAKSHSGPNHWPSDTTDLCTRTSWVDAYTAYKQVQKGKASGNKCALWVRWRLQKQLYKLGCFIQKHCGKVLFLGLLLLSLCCVGLKTASLETNVEKLWVEEGGRLQQELDYTKKVLGEGSGSTHELVIQTPAEGGNLLSSQSLLLHHKALKAATGISIELFDRTWKYSDLCFKPSFPSLDEEGFIDDILAHLQPCTIITPLDCFWEASKLLGPENGIHLPGYSGQVFRWTNLDPQAIVRSISSFPMALPVSVESIQEMLDRAGITSAYQEKPCLNPEDVDCPKTSPNAKTKQPVDIGRELTGGCSGFASRYMHWQEDLIVGGITRDKDGNIVKAEALQSMILLLGEREIYEYIKYYKTDFPTLDWSIEKAREVLQAWQRKFSQEINKVAMTSTTVNSTTDSIYPFTSASMLDLLQDFSKVSPFRVGLGYAMMLVYACMSLLRWSDTVQSQSGVGMAGVLLVSLSVAAGLGICSVLGIKFNASTTQIIPFLALGLGVDDMFLLIHTVAECASRTDIPFSVQTGESLKRVGVSILLTSLSNACAFFIAAIVPIPALRAFCLQAAILVLFNLATIMLVFPAVISIDTIRREQHKIDILCCLTGSTSTTNDTNRTASSRGRSPPPDYYDSSVPPAYSNPGLNVHQTIIQAEVDGTNPVTVLAPPTYDSQNFHCVPSNAVCPVTSSLPPSTTSSQQCLTPEDTTGCNFTCTQVHRDCCSWPLTRLARNVLAPLLQKTPSKIFTVVIFIISLVLGIVGTIRVQDGLDITDVVPRDTLEYKFLKTQSKYFGFYNFYAVTKKDFDYAADQQLLYDYHRAFQQVDKIIKRDDGTIPDFWLSMMRDWLLDMQSALDKDWKKGRITRDGWYKNATDHGIIGYMLMVQTGNMDKPVDKNRLYGGRLVDNGIIYPKAFYNYLTAWAAIDALAYYASEANLRPLPKDWYYIKISLYNNFHNATEDDVKIVKSQPLIFSQLAFYLHDLGDTTAIKATVLEIRDICENFAKHGLPNYPFGIVFTFWEQYLNLRFHLMLALICVLSGIFLVISIILMNPWTAIVVVLVLAMMVVELFGFMGLIGIKLSAVPAVILIVSVGIGVEFTVHICLGYITSIGSRNKRMRMALEHMFAPVIHGAMTTFLGVAMLAVSEFDFIFKYFFLVLTALIVIGLLNGLILLPVLLSVIGPKAEVIPADRSDYLAPPSPELPPPPLRREHPVRSVSRRVYPRIPSEISLTTITEEPSSQQSSHDSSQISIHVQPEVVVHTTVSGGEERGTNTTTTTTSTNTPAEVSTSTPSCSNGRHVTTVKATTKVMVQVHSNMSGPVHQDSDYKSRKRKAAVTTPEIIPDRVEEDSDMEYDFSDDSLSSS